MTDTHEWINLELADEWNRKDDEGKYLLLKEIYQKWKTLSALIFSEVYVLHTKYRLYAGSLIHDGNRASGTLQYVIGEYEKDNQFPKDLSGWHSAQNTLSYIHHAEVLLALHGIKINNA